MSLFPFSLTGKHSAQTSDGEHIASRFNELDPQSRPAYRKDFKLMILVTMRFALAIKNNQVPLRGHQPMNLQVDPQLVLLLETLEHTPPSQELIHEWCMSQFMTPYHHEDHEPGMAYTPG